MTPAELAFGAAGVLATVGTVIAVSGLAAVQQTCNATGDAGPQTHTLVPVHCSVFLSYFWVAMGMQLAFVLSTVAAIATSKVHTFRATLYSVGGVALSLGILQSWAAFRLVNDLPAGDLYNRWAAFIAGTAIYSAANILLSFSGDAMYCALRIERRDGFVTFRRLPSRWEAKLAEHMSEGVEGAAEPSQAGHLQWAFLGSLALALAGTCVALGGTASLQAYCADNGFIEHFFGRRVTSCDAYLSMLWLVWAIQVAFITTTGWAYSAKQIHNFRTSLWALAAVATALSCHMNALLYLLVNQTTGTMRIRYMATLVGFCCYCGGDFLLVILGDAMYRLKHEEGADGFVSMRRPGPAGVMRMPASSNGRQPWQAINVAFVASIAVACAGTLVALGGLGGAQASCNTDEAGELWGSLCEFFAYPWWTAALQIFVLTATIAAWATNNVHNFRAALWALATVVVFASSAAAYGMYGLWQGGSIKGSHQDSIVVLVYGLSIYIAGDLLFMAFGDALYQLRREEGADGFITFRRPKAQAAAPAEAGPAIEMMDGKASLLATAQPPNKHGSTMLHRK